jgi:hypothetical protein
MEISVTCKTCVRASILALFLFALPALAVGGVANSFDLPDTGYISNVVIDIIQHDGGVWFATDEGLNFSFDGGQTWLSYDSSNGLVSSSVSAMFSIPTGGAINRLWVATNHEERIQGALTPLSDGLSYTDDDGENWHRVDFDTIPYVTGGDRTIYDITGYYNPNPNPWLNNNWMFFSAFAGGLLASQDGGSSWRRIYASPGDSIQFNTAGQAPSLRNRYFCCAVDTSEGDTVSLWAGTAAGFFQYVYAKPKDKPYSKVINSIVPVDSFLFYGGNHGVTRGSKYGGPFISRFESDGLPGLDVTKLFAYGGMLFAGTKETTTGNSTGLAVSTDDGESFSPVVLPDVVGSDRDISDFLAMGDRLYMAAGAAGLYVTVDTGANWSQIYVDSSDVTSANHRNFVRSLASWGDTLLVGTDSGLVQLFMDNTGSIDSSRFHVFDEGAFSSTRVIGIRTHHYEYDSSDVILTINRPVSASGTPIVGRSSDYGVTWDTLQQAGFTNDIAFFGDTTFVLNDEDILFSADSTVPSNPSNHYYVYEYATSGAKIDSLTNDQARVMKVMADTVVIGTDNGFAISLDRGATYNIFRVNNDTLGADATLNYNSTLVGVSGDFIPAIDVQYLDNGRSQIWASTRPAFGGTEGISVGLFVPVVDTTVIPWDTLRYQRVFSHVYDNFAWNFAFRHDTVFAATNDGLIYSYGDTVYSGTWFHLDLKDSSGYPLILPNTPVYAVDIIGNDLWVGTADRSVKIDMNDFTHQTPYYVTDTRTPKDEVYAFPVPFSHANDAVTEFHFTLEKDADVTIEIYDFAMNLVRRVMDHQFLPAGVYPTAGLGRPTWDGLNGRGDPAAIGIYYFKVEYSTGEVRWGKLAVIP